MSENAIIPISSLPHGAIARIVKASNYSRNQVYQVLLNKTPLSEDNQIIVELAKDEIQKKIAREKKAQELRELAQAS